MFVIYNRFTGVEVDTVYEWQIANDEVKDLNEKSDFFCEFEMRFENA